MSNAEDDDAFSKWPQGEPPGEAKSGRKRGTELDKYPTETYGQRLRMIMHLLVPSVAMHVVCAAGEIINMIAIG